jgi:hypothetical protein
MKIQRLVLSVAAVVMLLPLGVLLHERTAAGQAVPTVLRAQAIELVDSRGRARAQLDVESNGEVVFRLRDAKGTIRVKIGASEDGSGLVFLNEATEPGVHILAKRTETSLTVQRGERRQVIRP